MIEVLVLLVQLDSLVVVDLVQEGVHWSDILDAAVRPHELVDLLISWLVLVGQRNLKPGALYLHAELVSKVMVLVDPLNNFEIQ